MLAEIWIWFAQFGQITQLALDERKMACTVHFKEVASAQAAASSQAQVMGDPKIEIIYNVAGVTQKPEQAPAPEQANSQQAAEEEQRQKMQLYKQKIEEKRRLVIEKYNCDIQKQIKLLSST